MFPDHAVYESYEIGKSRISKLLIRRAGEKRPAYHWDRGMDVPARTKKIQAIVDFLCAGVANLAYPKS